MESVGLSEKAKTNQKKSKETDYQRQQWAKHEDGCFRRKNQGPRKHCRREMSQVGEVGRRVTHAPPMRWHVGVNCRRRTRVTMHRSSVADQAKVTPMVGLSVGNSVAEKFSGKGCNSRGF